MKNIYIVGFMGTGKTTIGKIISNRLGAEFLDTDSLIEQKEKLSIPEIFSQFGESHFRELESKILSDVSQLKDKVVSSGGGIVINQKNIDVMKQSGVMIVLAASPEIIYERTKHSKNRPLLQVPNPLETIKRLLFERAAFYIKGDIIIDTTDLSPEEAADNILEEISAKGLR